MTPARSSARLLFSAICLLALSSVGAAPGAQSARDAQTSQTARGAKPTLGFEHDRLSPGDTTFITGQFHHSPRSRPVLAQVRRDGRWSTVARAHTYRDSGGFQMHLTSSCTGGRHSVRVVAPKKRIRGRTYARQQTRTVSYVVQALGTPAMGQIVRITNAAKGVGTHSISDSGDLVSYSSAADPLCAARSASRFGGTFVYDLTTGRTSRVSSVTGGVMSPDGTTWVFATTRRMAAEDRDESWDLFLLDRSTGAVRQIEGSGSPLEGARIVGVSVEAQKIALARSGRLYILDTRDESVVRASAGVEPTDGVALSSDGSALAFEGDPRQGDYHVFAYDTENQTLTQITEQRRFGDLDISADGDRIISTACCYGFVESVDWREEEVVYGGVDDAGGHLRPRLSGDGAYLVTPQGVGARARLARYGLEGDNVRYSPLSDGTGSEVSTDLDISGDGSVVIFATTEEWTELDRNGARDLFVWLPRP